MSSLMMKPLPSLVSQQMKWSSSLSTFNMNWFHCQIVLESVMGAAKGSVIVTGVIPKISLSGIGIDVL